MSDSVKIILVTRSGCGPCANFLAGPWKTLKDKLSYGVGSTGAVSNIDIARDGMDTVPPEIRRKLQFVPQIFALYSDGFVETPKHAINSPQGLKELEEWSAKGPPRYASTSSAVESSDEAIPGSDLEVVVVTSSTCPICIKWENSGMMQKFLDSLPRTFKSSHYNVPAGPPSNVEDSRRRMALAGIQVPSVIVVDRKEWLHPRADKPLTVLRSPVEVRAPEGLAQFKRWLSLLVNDDTQPFRGYMLLATSPNCGHCIRWKESGGMDQFVETNKNLPGILFSHNGYMTSQVRRHIQGYPTVLFVPASQWGALEPEVIEGPDVHDSDAISKWVADLLEDRGRWSNDPKFVPDAYQAKKSRPVAKLATKRPVMRRH